MIRCDGVAAFDTWTLETRRFSSSVELDPARPPCLGRKDNTSRVAERQTTQTKQTKQTTQTKQTKQTT